MVVAFQVAGKLHALLGRVKILLYKSRHPIGRLISLTTGSPYNHAAALLPDGSVVEAWSPGGVRHCAPGERHDDGTPVDVFRVPYLSPEQAVRIEQELLAHVGKPYDWQSVIWFLRKVPVDINPDAWFCSELVAFAFGSWGYPISRRSAHNTAPGHLAADGFLCLESRQKTSRSFGLLPRP